MKMVFTTALALALCASSAFAQTPTPVAPPAAPAASQTQAAQSPRDIRQQCRADAKAQGLRGAARKTAVQDCFAKARPDLAAAQKCRQDAKAQGLDGKALRQSVRECRAHS